MSDPTPEVEGIRQRPKVGPTRCPFCHDDCAASDPGTCVCGDCLSRHHVDCWEEASGCGSCRSQHRLEAVSPSGSAQPVIAQNGAAAEAEADLSSPQEEQPGESEWVPLELGSGGEIVVHGEIKHELGEPVGGELESREDLSSLFVLGNVALGLCLLWLMYRVISSV